MSEKSFEKRKKFYIKVSKSKKRPIFKYIEIQDYMEKNKKYLTSAEKDSYARGVKLKSKLKKVFG